jgi:hypothetical protein
VPIHSLAELCSWLQSCQYVSDRALVAAEDHWQHPVDFEQTRRGDCEDHALWAWRKSQELGLPATLVLGEIDSLRHVWVTLLNEDQLWVLETTRKHGSMLEPAEHAEAFRPCYGVDTELRTYAYDIFLEARERRNGT